MTTALVTGATAGIGLEFARQMAARGHDLVLVARNRERLEQVAGELAAAHGIRAVPFVADLAHRDQVQWVVDRINDPDAPVEILVNNAGFGLAKDFLRNEIGPEEELLDVLVRAVLVLSHAAALRMRERGSGQIINVASVAAFASLGTYSAAKAWVVTFTEGLATELRGTGVTATALCPGFTRTEFHQRAQMNMSRLPGVAWLDADRLVADALAAADAGAVLSVPGWQYKVLSTALTVIPRGVKNRLSGALSSGRRPANREG